VTARRAVSLVPSVTETLVAWGVPPVACTRFCERPELPHVGGTKDPDVAAIIGLGPDVVAMCDEENRREDADALTAAGLTVHSCSPRSVEDVGPALVDLAVAVAAPAPGDLVLPELEPLGLRAFVPIWRRPWMSMSATTYGSSVLARLGVENVCAHLPDRYPAVDLDEVRAMAPDVVLAPSEPYPFGPRHVSELERVAPTVLVDGQDLFWWGVRTPAALSRLHERVLRRGF
jgi:ABC-type Fe3+-hydroxamate transport system substrate-binding protein